MTTKTGPERGDGRALLETEPQGDASIPVDLVGHEGALAGLLATPEVSAALARLYLAGATAGERAARTAMRRPK